MPNSFDTSFIPQQPLLRVEATRGRREPINFALVLALILFFVVLISAGGIFFYERQIEARINTRSAELEAIEKDLDGAEIAQYKRVESRLRLGKVILKDHKVFSVILDMLAESAADNVGLTSLDFRRDEKGTIVTVGGVGPSYQSAYFQLETWRSPVFASLVKQVNLQKIALDDTTGIVSFDADIVLDDAWLAYAKLVEATARAPEANADSQTP